MKEDCIFCKIARGDIPSEKVYEDDEIFVIKDINPKAKLHYLMIPKHHFKMLADMTEEDCEVLKRAFAKIPKLASKLKLSNGFRIVINQGEDGCQTVPHLHIHLLGGEKLPE